MDRSIVEFDVENSSSVVFDGILDSSYCNNENQRNGVETWIDATKNGKDDQDNQEQEEYISNIVELEPQVFRNE